MPLFSEVDGCLWSTEQRLPNSGRKERKLVVWACPSCHFILCQKSPRFTRQTLDRGHILGFLDLHGCPDVSMPPPSAQNQPATNSLVRQQSTLPSSTHSSYPCCLPLTPPPLCPWELSNYRLLSPHCTHAPSFIIILCVYMSAIHLATQLWSLWFMFMILATKHLNHRLSLLA